MLYLSVITVSITLLAILYVFIGGAWIGGAISIIFLAMTAITLIDVGASIKIKPLKKKYFTYIGIVVVQFFILQIISAVTGISTYNTWLALVWLGATSATIVFALIDFSKALKKTHSLLALILRFVVFLTITISTILVIVFLAGLIY